MNARLILGALFLGVLLADCGGGGAGGVPPVSQPPLQPDQLQLAVGTANIAGAGTGLNVVATFRKPNGDSATLANTPVLTGPPGFRVPPNFPGAYGGASVDAGTNRISSSPQVNLSVTPPNTILGTFSGVFSYGLAPLNSDNTGTAYYPGSPNAAPGNGFANSPYDVDGAYWEQPFLGANGSPPAFTQDVLGGPPAYPFFNNGTAVAGFAGYSQGFAAFAVPPATGSYALNVAVTVVNGPSSAFAANATMRSINPLPLPVIGGFIEDGNGGGSASVTIPPDPRTSETMLYVTDTAAITFYTVGPVQGTGTKTFVLPDFLGACNGVNCQTDPTKQAASIVSGDTYQVMAISYDYPVFEAGPPANTSPTPAIVGANGQADLAMSHPWGGTYGSGAAPLSIRRALHVRKPIH